jgi:AcrR family transcriptional regulator
MTTSAPSDDWVDAAAVQRLPDAPTRRWAKTDATQQRILDAATDVFAARGFTAATMADIVEGSGASIGSIYHHFGGKKELFLAIFERLGADIDRCIDAATDRSGDLDRQHAFEANARAYLYAMWANRRAAMLLVSGDTPAGFDTVRRSRMLRGFRRWASVLELDTSPRGQLLTRTLTAVMAEASTMVITCTDAAEVGPITDATIECIERLTR